MSDEELVYNVAKKVMGWTCVKHGSPASRINYRTISPLPENDFEEEWRVWGPLEDWNAAMMVVEAMREKGWLFGMLDCVREASFVNLKEKRKSIVVYSDSRKRDILVAALAAMENQP